MAKTSWCGVPYADPDGHHDSYSYAHSHPRTYAYSDTNCYTHTNAECYTDGNNYSYIYGDSHAYSYTHSHSDSDSDTCGNGHADLNSDTYCAAYSDTKVYAGTKASADSAASPLGCGERRDPGTESHSAGRSERFRSFDAPASSVAAFARFISLIFRWSVRRLMPSFLAAAVTLPFVAASA